MVWFQKIIASIVSFLLAIAAMFGIHISTKPDVQNVVYMIGDGMGELHLEKTKHDRGIELAMDTMPQRGYATTYSASDAVTDSAAGATALACGVKTYNGAIGYYWAEEHEFHKQENSHPKNLTELCMENGMKTGIITTDTTDGATPGGFSAHTTDRGNSEDIYDQQLASGIDLIWGKGEDYVTREKAESAGYTFVDSIESMNAVTSSEKSFGQFTASLYHTYNKNSHTPTLSQMTERAIDILSTDNDDGFFLLVEGAHIDKKSHNKDGDGATEALEEFDNAVEKALEFAKEDKHTLVVVTADHETGGIVLNADGSYTLTKGGHTAANVPVIAYGPYDFIKDGEVINNIQIPVKITEALEFKKNSLPCEVKD